MSKSEATKAAKKLKRKLKGKGWEIRVWENLGWNYCVHNRSLYIYPHEYKGKTTYHSLMSADTEGAGDSDWTDNFNHADPNKVVEHQLEIAKSHVIKLSKFILEVEEVLK